MLVKFWKRVSKLGLTDDLESYPARQIILTNRISFISGVITWIILLFHFLLKPGVGWNSTRLLILLAGAIFFSVVFLNKWRMHSTAKWTLCWVTVFFILLISVFDKIYSADFVTINDFFSYRFLLFSSAIIPLLVFGASNKKLLLINLFPSFAGAVFFNQLHRLIGIDSDQFGVYHSYYMLDIIVAMAYFALTGFIFSHIAVAERIGRALQIKQQQLEDKNRELLHKNAFINEQNYEISTKSEELIAGNEALVMAQKVIEQQKELLENQNKLLEQQVSEKTERLARANDELIIKNNELRQFSHALSHNLKSPVATFQGLLNLFDWESLNEANKEIFRYMQKSVQNMQKVFADLNEMLELRNELYISMDRVPLRKEIDSLLNDFYKTIISNNIKFSCNFNGSVFIHTNAKRLNAVLYQVLSNAVKFRSDKRTPEIKVDYKECDQFCAVSIRDNGLGFDMDQFKEKLFFPYQKFHTYVSGKGLGLFVAKTLMETLNGDITIDSKPDEYTQVDLVFRK